MVKVKHLNPEKTRVTWLRRNLCPLCNGYLCLDALIQDVARLEKIVSSNRDYVDQGYVDELG